MSYIKKLQRLIFFRIDKYEVVNLLAKKSPLIEDMSHLSTLVVDYGLYIKFYKDEFSYG